MNMPTTKPLTNAIAHLLFLVYSFRPSVIHNPIAVVALGLNQPAEARVRQRLHLEAAQSVNVVDSVAH